MLTIKDISEIVNGVMRDAENKELNEINDFETMYRFVTTNKTAYISANKETWWRELGRDRGAPDGNSFIDKNSENIGVIITEEYVPGMKFQIPQIIVEDSVQALKSLAIHIRNNYKNPVIAITGSMGKSSTRILMRTLLQGYTAVQNRGNNNIRAAIYANMCKLIKNHQFAVIETSLNAINNRGNSALDLKPDVAIVTGIGAAHFSTFNSLKEIAELKSRIFDGLSEDGIAIINKDTLYSDYLIERAKENTKHVFTYSIHDNTADLFVSSYKYQKGATDVTVEIDGDVYNYTIPSISEGMVSNSLAVLLALSKLHVPLKMDLFKNFKPFVRVLGMNKVSTPSGNVTLIDDTHNASLPAMINAIRAFDTQVEFFKGNKILALGKISDLGDKADLIHAELIEVIQQSKADYILCMNDEFGKVVSGVKNKHITWYPNIELLKNDLIYLCNDDSLVLLKSSVTGTELPVMARNLPNELRERNIEDENLSVFDYMSKKGKAHIIFENETGEIVASENVNNSQTIEGLGPVINFMKAIDAKMTTEDIIMKQWATNNDEYFEGKEVNTIDLLKEMTLSPYPSATYEFSKYLFRKSGEREKYEKDKIESMNLSNSCAINLTGRFMMKQRQSFTINDLMKIYNVYKNDLFKFSNSFLIGRRYLSGYYRGDRYTIVFTSYDKKSEVLNILNDKINELANR